MRVFPVTAAMGIVHSGIILHHVSMAHIPMNDPKVIRREVERSYAGTDTEGKSSDFGIHIFADWDVYM
jgi:hypothetical protein